MSLTEWKKRVLGLHFLEYLGYDVSDEWLRIWDYHPDLILFAIIAIATLFFISNFKRDWAMMGVILLMVVWMFREELIMTATKRAFSKGVEFGKKK